VELTLPGTFGKAQWYGLGPGETYADSHAAGRTGIWRSGLDGLHTDYCFPQENGLRSQTRWASLTDDRGTGLWVASGADETFSFGAHPYTVKDLEAARHQHEVPRRDEVTLTLDHRHTGLGSGSCGPLTFESYRVARQPWSFSFVLALFSRQAVEETDLWKGRG